jgi:hypothetical protein
MKRHAVAIVPILVCGLAGAADQPDPKVEAETVTQLAKAEAGLWEFRADDRGLERFEDPILRWSNPSVGRVYGDVYVWTKDGCPAAVGSLYKWFAPYDDFTLEFKTLGNGKVVGRREGEVRWEPAQEDVQFQPLADAPAPDDSSAGRLRQMRSIATEFTISLNDTRVERVTGSRQELRSLPRPIFRYESRDPAVVDGAMFAFVHGTDPEALLLLEARTRGGGVRWEYALARLNTDALVGRYRGEDVWSVAPLEVMDDPRSPYVLLPGRR